MNKCILFFHILLFYLEDFCCFCREKLSSERIEKLSKKEREEGGALQADEIHFFARLVLLTGFKGLCGLQGRLKHVSNISILHLFQGLI